MPTIAISDRTAPEALVVGFHPTRTHLVLSQGTIAALDRDELEAVIAHELAHVANRDAIVMTAISLPVVLAGGARARISGSSRAAVPTATNAPDGGDGWLETGVGFVGVFVLLVAVPTHVVGRLIVAVLARSREGAADRAAVEVTGSPAALVSALQTLDQRIQVLPDRDLRSVAAVSSLSVLPLDPAVPHPRKRIQDAESPPRFWAIRRPIRWLEWRLFATHPSTDRRLERISEFVADRDDR